MNLELGENIHYIYLKNNFYQDCKEKDLYPNFKRTKTVKKQAKYLWALHKRRYKNGQ